MMRNKSESSIKKLNIHVYKSSWQFVLLGTDILRSLEHILKGVFFRQIFRVIVGVRFRFVICFYVSFRVRVGYSVEFIAEGRNSIIVRN